MNAEVQPRKRLKAADRRRVFLDAAHEIVRTSGTERLTMDGLAAHCGVNKALPYRFFKNRDAVLVALYEQTNEEIDAMVLPAVEKAQNFEARLEAVVEGWVSFMESGRDLPSLQQARTADGSLEAIRDARVAGIVDFISDEIMAGRDVNKRDAYLVAAVLVAGTQGLVHIIQSTPLSAKELAKGYLKMAMGAIDRMAEG
ncbi:MAG: TetR/AcrR family transcriptional regulator [Alphaproteobacteria bacterium]